MRKVLTGVTLAASVVLLAGCNHGSSLQSNKAVSADEQQAQAIVQKCAAKSNFLSKNGRHAFYVCIAPPGKEVQVQSCATKALSKDGVITKAARVRFENDLARCIVK